MALQCFILNNLHRNTVNSANGQFNKNVGFQDKIINCTVNIWKSDLKYFYIIHITGQKILGRESTQTLRGLTVSVSPKP